MYRGWSSMVVCGVYSKPFACFVIPARGGSKGIKNKNIKAFNGRPLIAWTIQAALETKLGPVLVSSDSEEILKVAEKYGAIAIKRPEDIAGDKSRSEDAVFHALTSHFGTKTMPHTTFFLQCTSPFLTSEDYSEAYKAHRACCGDATIIAKKQHNYPHKKIEGQEHFCEPVFGPKRLMRQDMEKYICELGAYIFNTDRFMETKDRFCGETELKYHIVDRELPPEIDSPIDFLINETYFDYWRGGKEPFCINCGGKLIREKDKYCSVKCYHAHRAKTGWYKTPEMQSNSKCSPRNSKAHKKRIEMPDGEESGKHSMNWR